MIAGGAVYAPLDFSRLHVRGRDPGWPQLAALLDLAPLLGTVAAPRPGKNPFAPLLLLGAMSVPSRCG